ncbi:acyl-CoA thioesterase [bacterium]|nr:acyl-CoA thioesterase [bacterium]
MRSEAVVRVRYGETDARGVVYHANFFRYFEVGRVELLRSRGISYRQLEASGIRLAVVEARASYDAPARFDALITVGCEVGRLRAARIDLRYDVTARTDGEPRRLALGETVLACLGSDGVPCRLPASVRAALGEEGSA